MSALEEKYITITHAVRVSVNGADSHMMDVDHDTELGTILDAIYSEFDTEVLHDFIVALDYRIDDMDESLKLLNRLGESLANTYPRRKERLMACLKRYEEIIQGTDDDSDEPILMAPKVQVLKSIELKEEWPSEPKQPTIKEEDGVITPAF